MPAQIVSGSAWPIWVIVANEAEAEIYTRHSKSGSLDDVFVLTNPASRQKAAELDTDRAGRSFDSHGQGRHALAQSTNAKQQAALRFAHDIARRIADGMLGKTINGYALIAAPRFLGLLRSEIETHSLKDPVMTADKDIVGRTAATIERVIDEYRG